MDCCSHEVPAEGDARFDIVRVADGVHVAVAAPAYKVNSNTAIVESDDGVLIVDTHSKPSAARVIVERLRALTPKPVRYVVNTHFKQRVPDRLAPTHERAFSAYADYRPWRTQILGNIERIFATEFDAMPPERRTRQLAMVNALLTPTVWDQLRHMSELDVAAARKAVADAIIALMGGAE